MWFMTDSSASAPLYSYGDYNPIETNPIEWLSHVAQLYAFCYSLPKAFKCCSALRWFH